MSLSAAPVSEFKLEETISLLFNEWLTGYFDGGSHAVGYNSPTPFPTAAILFQQAEVPQPLNGVAISLVWLTRAKPRLYWDAVNGKRQQLALVDLGWLFIVRAQLAEAGQGNAKKFAQNTSDLLFAILQNNNSAKPLAEKGIHHLRPETPQIMSEGTGAKQGDPAYAMRSVTCTGRVRYHILSQPTT
jgi:hypothetical protein